jgi:hypothetical protein
MDRRWQGQLLDTAHQQSCLAPSAAWQELVQPASQPAMLPAAVRHLKQQRRSPLRLQRVTTLPAHAPLGLSTAP